MKTLLTAALCAALAPFSLTAQEHPAGKPPAAKPAAAAKAETFAVVKLGDEMKVVSSTELAAMQKKAEADHKKAMDEYEKARKAAEAAKKKFDQKAPEAASIVVEHGDFPTKEAAVAELAKLKAAKDKEKDKDKNKGKDGKSAGGDSGKHKGK